PRATRNCRRATRSGSSRSRARAARNQPRRPSADCAASRSSPKKVTGSKEVRAEPYAAQVQAGNVMLKAASWNRDFLDGHATSPSGKRKHIVDAAAGAFNKLAAPALRYDTSLSWIDGTPL